jgi:hypothetical protein
MPHRLRRAAAAVGAAVAAPPRQQAEDRSGNRPSHGIHLNRGANGVVLPRITAAAADSSGGAAPRGALHKPLDKCTLFVLWLPMMIQLEIILIAAVAAVGLIVLGKAIITGFAISRRPSHHLADQTGTSPVPPEAQIPPSNH